MVECRSVAWKKAFAVHRGVPVPAGARVVLTNGFVPVLGRRVAAILGVGMPEVAARDKVSRYTELLRRWDCFLDAVKLASSDGRDDRREEEDVAAALWVRKDARAETEAAKRYFQRCRAGEEEEGVRLENFEDVPGAEVLLEEKKREAESEERAKARQERHRKRKEGEQRRREERSKRRMGEEEEDDDDDDADFMAFCDTEGLVTIDSA